MHFPTEPRNYFAWVGKKHAINYESGMEVTYS